MNKTELIEFMSQKTGLTKVDSKKALDAFIDVTSNALKNGERVSLIGLGSLVPTERPSRVCRNPKTGEKITVASKVVVKFKASRDLL
ncbi:MAG: HU family DNA-binding protein [Candidatus Limimorpha sp.]